MRQDVEHPVWVRLGNGVRYHIRTRFGADPIYTTLCNQGLRRQITTKTITFPPEHIRCMICEGQRRRLLLEGDRGELRQ